MPNPSIHTHAQQPESRRLNVEANLLSERLAERQRIIDACRRKLFVILCTAVTGLLVVPSLYRLQSAAKANSVAASSAAAIVAEELGRFTQEQETAMPWLANERMIETTRRQTGVFLGQLMYVLNSVPDEMAISSLSVEVIGGDMTLRGRADAEAIAVAQKFLSTAASGPGARSIVLVSTRRSGMLARSGVEFEFLKRVTVDQ